MQSDAIHVRSAILGMALAGFVMLLTSWEAAAKKGLSENVRIVQGVPYQVPAGDLLTLRAVSGTGDSPADVKLLINGQAVAILRSFGAVFEGVGVTEVPPGVTAQGGDVITLEPLYTGGPDLAVLFCTLSREDP